MERVKKLLSILLINAIFITMLQAENFTKTDNNITVQLKHHFKKKRKTLLKQISNKRFIRNFYYKQGYQPLWLDQKGLKKQKYQNLFSHITNDLTLNPHGYLLKATRLLKKDLENNITKEELFRTEIKLTSLYYDFLKHTIYGEILWKNFSRKLHNLKRHRVNAHWVKKRPKFNMISLISNPDINSSIEKVLPKNFGYDKLIHALEKLHEIKVDGEWSKLPYFKILKKGSTGEVVLQLRERLKISKDYISCENNSSNDQNSSSTQDSNSSIKEKHIDPNAIFGICLEKAVKHFQQRHGLTVDGIVGGGTQKALNVSVDSKIKTVLLNIDRIKWLPRQEDKRYLIVNLPEFMLYYLQDTKVHKKLRVIIGDKKHPTPIFSQKISYIVLNPYWKIPEGIVRREVIPAMIRNRNYLKKQGIVAHRTWNENSRIINVRNLYWEQYLWRGVKFPYRLMQPPGPRNALGKIKFKFPNRFAVYLHDTPARHLFKKDVRAFSHGCVRLSQPKSLLESIALFNKNINLKRANKILVGKRKVQYNIKNKLPIYIIYLTAGMNSDGELEFRNDIYQYDKLMKRSLK